MIVLIGCAYTIRPVDYAFTSENVTEADQHGMVIDQKYWLKFNVKGLMFDEMQDSSKAVGAEIHIIRNSAGFYFVTAPKFKNVYIFSAGENSFSLKTKVLISEKGLAEPYFNYSKDRAPYVEIGDGKTSLGWYSTDGKMEGTKK